MAGSSIFSINLTNRKNPSNLNYHMSIKKSQAILKHFIDLKFSVWFTLCSENETMFRDTQHFFQLPLSSFLFPLSSFLFPLSSFPFANLFRKDRGDHASRVDYRSFSVLKTLTGGRPEISSSKCHKTWFRFLSSASVNQTLDLRSIKHFRIA